MTMILEFALADPGLQRADGARRRDRAALLRSRAVDRGILDMLMPAMDGLTLCQRIRARSEVPIMLLTALAQPTT